MGKFIRKRRRADVAVLEGCSGVRTSSSSRPAVRSGACKSMTKEVAMATRDPRPNRENSPVAEDEDARASSSVQESFEQDVPAEEVAEDVDRRAKRWQASSSSSRLRESHSDSCLKDRTVAAAAHSRSNSATFSQDQALVAVDHQVEDSEHQVTDRRSISAVESSSLEATSTKEIEASCCGDNTLVLFASKESQTTGVSGISIPDPASSNEKKLQSSSGSRFTPRARSASDCGPAWRHRVAASAPTCDEIEEFFARVEAKDDSSSKRFVDKYNFDVFNDVPLSGRFEWVQFHSRCS